MKKVIYLILLIILSTSVLAECKFELNKKAYFTGDNAQAVIICETEDRGLEYQLNWANSTHTLSSDDIIIPASLFFTERYTISTGYKDDIINVYLLNDKQLKGSEFSYVIPLGSTTVYTDPKKVWGDGKCELEESPKSPDCRFLPELDTIATCITDPAIPCTFVHYLLYFIIGIIFFVVFFGKKK